MNHDGWTTVRVARPANRAAVIAALFELGADGVQEVGDDLVTHFRDIDRARVTAALVRADNEAPVEFASLPAVDWSAQWKARITAHRVGLLVVTPPWLAENFPAEERLVIEPAMAFGTGEHETTRGVLRLMSSVIRRGDLVADLGAGSAVLAIGAVKLGAKRAVAIELDPDAIGNAESNAEANGVADRVSVIEGDAFALLPLVAPVRVVLANIVSSVLIRLLPLIESALTPDGVAILSGILATERPEMEAELQRAGWNVLATDEEGAWWSATIARH
ncbi:MAG TPA: 50S ribosomal protein L11 methyltransferase [Gemmatimonadaceae bacterium]|nr:50S ribosomal protein L11 methyltransferase [Gemmatimonadaceae bacterium]